MYVSLEPVSGTPKEYLDRARAEMERVLGFRGSVTSAKAKEGRIIVKFEINPAWDLPMSEKVKLLKEWIPAKTKLIFKVHDVYPEGKAKGEA
jgi:hypothetical protein